jgi:hypothetical protein
MHMRHDNPTRDLAGQIERLAADGHYRPDEWLRFLTMDVLAGFGKRLDEPWDPYRQERLYALTKQYGRLVAEHPWRDLLGGTYMLLGANGQHRWLGQYFTPQCVAGLAAGIAFHDLDLDAIPASRFIRILEPAAGAGAMLLAACGEIATAHGAAALRRCSFTAIDLDALCAQMTACQLLANGALHGALGELLVYRGNALGPDAQLEVVVHLTAGPSGGRAELQPEIVPAMAPARIEAIRQAVIGQQLSLFDDADLPIPARKRA